MEYDIFVSYSRKDSEIVQSVVDRLKAEGFRCWMDVTGIESSDEFKRVLVKAIRRSKVILFFSSANSNSTEWTVKEINIAVQLKKPIIPVRLDCAPYDDSILSDLSGLDYIPCRDGAMHVSDSKKLLRAVVKHCGTPAKDVVNSCKGMSESNPRLNVDRAVMKRSNIKWLRAVIPMATLSIGMLVYFSIRYFSARTGMLLVDEFRIRDEILGWPVDLNDEKGIGMLASELVDLEVLEQDWKWLNNLTDPNVIATVRLALSSIESNQEEARVVETQIKMLEAELLSVDRQLDSEIKQEAPVFKLGE